MKRKKIVWYFFIAALALFMVFSLSQQPQANATLPTTKKQHITTVQVQQLTLTTTYEASYLYAGEVKAHRSSDLSFERGGKLAVVYVEEADEVKADSKLATLVDAELLAKHKEITARKEAATAKLREMENGPRQETIATAQTQLKNLRRQLQLMKNIRERRQALYDAKSIAPEDLEKANLDVVVLQTQVEDAQHRVNELLQGTRQEQIEGQRALLQELEALLQQVNLQIAQGTLKAPHPGKISIVFANEGEIVAAGQPILRLLKNDMLKINIGLPAHLLANFHRGDQQQIFIEKQSYTATVHSILPQFDQQTRTATLILLLNNSSSSVRPGQLAYLPVVFKHHVQGFWVPTTALAQAFGNIWSCFTIIPTQQVENPPLYTVTRRNIEIIYIADNRIFIHGNLAPGEWIISGGTHRIVPGQLVTPLFAEDN